MAEFDATIAAKSPTKTIAKTVSVSIRPPPNIHGISRQLTREEGRAGTHCCGFSLAVSGMMMPPVVFSSASMPLDDDAIMKRAELHAFLHVQKRIVIKPTQVTLRPGDQRVRRSRKSDSRSAHKKIFGARYAANILKIKHFLTTSALQPGAPEGAFFVPDIPSGTCRRTTPE